MPDPQAKDTARTRETGQPTPNEVSGYYLTDPETGKLTNEWVAGVDPSLLDPESHVAIVPRDGRDGAGVLSVPLADA